MIFRISILNLTFFFFSFSNSNYSWVSRPDLILIQTLELRIHRWWGMVEYHSSINESGLSLNSWSWEVEVLSCFPFSVDADLLLGFCLSGHWEC